MKNRQSNKQKSRKEIFRNQPVTVRRERSKQFVMKNRSFF